ncbi:WhiB family transcriptional regulator [Nonomuraea sp. NPDC004297]
MKLTEASPNPGSTRGAFHVDALVGGMPRHLVETAECRFDPDLHAGPDAFVEEPAEARAVREQVAREVCAECPARAWCLDFALALRPASGVWAGLTAEEICALPPAPHVSALKCGTQHEVTA